MIGLFYFAVILAIIDWGYARLSLRDERRYRVDLQRRVKESCVKVRDEVIAEVVEVLREDPAALDKLGRGFGAEL